MDINLRLIQQEEIKDRENYFALQKSVALFPDRRLNFEKDLEDKFWQDQFEKNRVCYVIETIPECLYCGECAVKDITADIPEVEIELMQEYQHQGIGYKAMFMMFDQLAKKYGKQEFCAKIEPDNFASQFLFEKLGGVPIGLARDCAISEERVEQFTESHRSLLDEKIQNVAKKFDVKADLLLANVLVYKLNYSDLPIGDIRAAEVTNKRKYIECSRTISRAKYKDNLMEHMEALEEILNCFDDKDKVMAKLTDMESKLSKKIEAMKMTGLNELEM